MYEFKKIYNNHNRVRDDVIICKICSVITEGESIRLIAEPRDSTIDGIRCIITSQVTKVTVMGKTTRVVTENGSIYEITEL